MGIWYGTTTHQPTTRGTRQVQVPQLLRDYLDYLCRLFRQGPPPPSIHPFSASPHPSLPFASRTFFPWRPLGLSRDTNTPHHRSGREGERERKKREEYLPHTSHVLPWCTTTTTTTTNTGPYLFRQGWSSLSSSLFIAFAHCGPAIWSGVGFWSCSVVLLSEDGQSSRASVGFTTGAFFRCCRVDTQTHRTTSEEYLLWWANCCRSALEVIFAAISSQHLSISTTTTTTTLQLTGCGAAHSDAFSISPPSSPSPLDSSRLSPSRHLPSKHLPSATTAAGQP